MAKYKVTFKELQTWVYEYDIEADSMTQALEIGQGKFFKGEQSDDNFLDDSRLLDSEVEEL